MVDKIFLTKFTDEELSDIVEDAMVIAKNCIIINTTNNFFELSVDSENKLDIYCNSNENDTEQQLTKDEFMKLYKDSPLKELHHIKVDE